MQRVEWEGSESLRFLDLSENRLTSAHGLGECPALLQLSLAENRIARVGERKERSDSDEGQIVASLLSTERTSLFLIATSSYKQLT